MIFDILEKSKIEKKFIAIWIYGGDDGFWSGYVKDYTNDFVILQHFTKYGKSDGLIVERIENIQSIEFEDDYSRAMEYLIEHAAEIDNDDDVKIQINDHDTWQNDILGNLIGKKDRIVTVQINKENYYSGFVEWCEGEHFVLSLIGKIGQDEGKSLFKIEDINSIRVNDIDNRKKLLLYNWRKNFK